MPGIGIVLNPHSKRYKKNPGQMRRLGFVVGDRGWFQTTKDMHDLRLVAQEFKERDIDILAVTGGDGTNHCTLSTFIDVYQDKPLPKFTFLRGGTMNTLATCFNIRGTPEKILSNVLFKYHEGTPFETVEIDTLKINGRYGFIFGCGLISRFLHIHYRAKNPSPLRAGLFMAEAIISCLVNGPMAQGLFRRFDGTVKGDGRLWPFKNYSALYASTIPNIGLYFRVFYLAGVDPNTFHGVGFSMAPRPLLWLLPKMFVGKPTGSPDLYEEKLQRMEMQFPEPLQYTIDGDLYGPEKNIVIEPGPRLTVVVR